MCGEKNIVRKASFDPQGSPPHVRGKDLIFHLDELEGLDHPRMCGEKTKKIP